MFLIPVGTARELRNRIPYATAAIAIVTVLVFLGTQSRMDKEAESETRLLEQALAEWASRGHTALPDDVLAFITPPLRKLYDVHREWVRWYESSPEDVRDWLDARSGAGHRIRAIEAFAGGSRAMTPDEVIGLATGDARKREVLQSLADLEPAERAAQQASLDQRVEDLRLSWKRSTARRFGFVPARKTAAGLLGHMFLHAGWMHLALNLLFLLVAAVSLEDCWSWPVLVVGYLFFGVVGALAHAAANTSSVVPMIGASGAVSGLIGAFLIRLYDTRIRFWYLYILLSIRSGSFEAPAWLMIPLWFAGELFYALFVPGDGVAYWAHVGGFCAGAATALVLVLSGFEARFFGLDGASKPAAGGMSSSVHVDGRPTRAPEELPRVVVDPAPLRPEPAAAPATPAGPGADPAPDMSDLDAVARRIYPGVDAGAGGSEPDALAERLAGPSQRKRKVPPTLGRALRSGDRALVLHVHDRLRDSGVATMLGPLEELHLAKILRDAGRHMDAVKACRRAAEADMLGPFATRGIYFAGRILIQNLDRADDGLTLLRQLAAMFPGDRFARAAMQLIQETESDRKGRG